MSFAANRTLAIWTAAVLLGLTAAGAAAKTETANVGRFFFCGDGRLDLAGEKSGESFAGKYRLGRGDYDPAALKAICRVFDAPCEPQKMSLSLRLIEFLDFLQDQVRARFCNNPWQDMPPEISTPEVEIK
jgi:hypothetical protein